MKTLAASASAAFTWILLTLGIGWGISECAAAPANIAGKWLGTIAVPGMELRVAFEIAGTKEGGHTAKMHSIDQSAMNIPVSAVTLTGDSLRMEVKSIPTGSSYMAHPPDYVSCPLHGKSYYPSFVPAIRDSEKRRKGYTA